MEASFDSIFFICTIYKQLGLVHQINWVFVYWTFEEKFKVLSLFRDLW